MNKFNVWKLCHLSNTSRRSGHDELVIYQTVYNFNNDLRVVSLGPWITDTTADLKQRKLWYQKIRKKTRRHRVRNLMIHRNFKLLSLLDKIQSSQLRWLDHVCRMAGNRYPLRTWETRPDGRQGKEGQRRNRVRNGLRREKLDGPM